MKEKTTPTTYSNKAGILATLWLNYRNDVDFVDFIEYNDLGLPLAYAIAEGIVDTSPTAQKFIEETYDLLLAGLDIEDNGFESLDDVLENADKDSSE